MLFDKFTKALTITRLIPLLCLSAAASAEEGGAGHHFPGSISSFIDGVPHEEQLVTRLDTFYYDGGFRSGVPVPIGGLSALNVDGEITTVAFTSVWRPPFELGGPWSYAAGITVPLVDLKIAGDLNIQPDEAGPTLRRSDTTTGLGDIVLYPFMLNYKHSDALNYNFRVNLYAPTGDYEAGKLANAGRNYWSLAPIIGAVYFSPENGREFTAYLGATFNEENGATDYESGTQAFIEATAAQHLPCFGAVCGIGLAGYWYEQLNGDSGEGARFGDFEARVKGIGPTVSYIREFGDTQLAAELKWISEFDVERRAEGDLIYLKVVLTI